MSERESATLSRRTVLEGIAGATVLGIGPAGPATGLALSTDVVADDFPQLDVPAGSLKDSFLPTFGRIRVLDDYPAYETLNVETAASRLYELDPTAVIANVPTDYDAEVPDMEMAVAGANIGPETRRLQLEMDCPMSLHVGFDYHASDDRPWYESLPTEEKYRWPDGSVVEDFWDLAGINKNGNRFGRPDEWIIPSSFADGTVELLFTPASNFLSDGLASVNFDFTVAPRLEGLDFSEWAQASFRSHLESLPGERLAELGIDNPASFDMLEYLRTNDLDGRDADRAGDPVVREYTIHDHQGLQTLWNTVTERVAENDYPAPSVGTTPNADPLWNAPVAGIYLHESFDVVGFEESTPTVPPASVRDSLYKLGLAAGRFEKLPLDHEMALSPPEVDEFGFDLDVRYTTLMRLQAAEAYANGGRLGLNLFVTAGGQEFWENPELQPIRWVNTDGTIPDAFPPFVDFLLANRRFLEDVSPDNRIAVVYSLPTMLWNTYPQWEDRPERYRDSFEGAAALLREYGYPHDVVVFGHPRIWEDPAQYERLTDYDAVVLPEIEAITANQVDLLRRLLDEGVQVVVSGTPPTRSGMYEPREDASDLLRNHEGAQVLDSDPGHQRMAEGTQTTALTDAIASPRDVALSTDAHVGVNRMAQSDPARTVVHLVNYEYDVSTDEVQPHEDVTVTVRGHDGPQSVARWYTENGVTMLETTETEDGVKVTVPRLDIWGFVVFGDTEAALHPGDPASARSAVDRATKAVEAATAENRHRELYHAEHALSNARAMLDHDAYRTAETWAETTVESAGAAHGPPTIGFDVGHGQGPSGTGYERFQSLRSQFERYDYVPVEAFDAETLASIDVLVVPPTKQSADVGYEFTEDEIGRVRQFVEAGGSLMVLGHADMDRGVNELLSTFELRVSDRQVAAEGQEAVTSVSQLTLDFESFDVDSATPLAEPPDAATVVARLLGDSADGAPVYVARPWGDGAVAYLGSWGSFVDVASDRRRLLSATALEVLGRRAARTLPKESDLSKATITSRASSTGTPKWSTTPRTTTEDAPGFGFLAAVIGVVSALAAYWRSRSDD